MSRGRLCGRVAVLVVGLLIVAGCSAATGGADRAAGRQSAEPAHSGPSCMSATDVSAAPGAAAPRSAAPGSAAPGGGPTGAGEPAPAGAGEELPDVALPCFVGGQPVRLAHLGVPVVINLWASWCGPCRAELPQIQRYADRSAGRVRVVGVITNDPIRSRPRSLIDDLGLTFPMVTDESAALQHRVGAPGLPMTLLVDAGGRVAYRYHARPLDEAALADLVERHLGVRT